MSFQLLWLAGGGGVIDFVDTIQIGGEALECFFIPQELCPCAEAQQPAEELMGRFDLCYQLEMVGIDVDIGGSLLAETLIHRVQQGIDEKDGHPPLFPFIHREGAFGVVFQVDGGKCFLTLSWLSFQPDAIHPVYAEGLYSLRFIHKRQQVVISFVDKELIGADDEGFPLSALHLFPIQIIFKILELYFLRRDALLGLVLHCYVDGADII